MLLLLKNLLFTLLVPGTVALYLPLFIARNGAPASGPTFFLAVALFLIGSVIYAWCVWDFAVFGGGTPAPIDAPKKLVVHGLYRYTRNPIYLGGIAVLLGWVVMFREKTLVIYALCVAACFHLFVVFYEEPHLRRLFGAAYDDYCAKVGRWLPRLGSRQPT